MFTYEVIKSFTEPGDVIGYSASIEKRKYKMNKSLRNKWQTVHDKFSAVALQYKKPTKPSVKSVKGIVQIDMELV